MDRVFKVGEGTGGPAQPGEGCKLPPAGFRAEPMQDANYIML